MKQQNDIQELVNRFFEGTTTLEEERAIYDYFRSDGVSRELAPLRQMFLDMAAIRLPHTATASPMLPRWHRWVMAVAAVFTGLVVLSAVVRIQTANSCEAYIYGQRVSNRDEVMLEVRSTMGNVVTGSPDVACELKGILE